MTLPYVPETAKHADDLIAEAQRTLGSTPVDDQVRILTGRVRKYLIAQQTADESLKTQVREALSWIDDGELESALRRIEELVK